MNVIEYKISDIENFKLNIWNGGVCDSLAKIALYDDTVIFDCSGHINIRDYVKALRDSSITDRFVRCLSIIRKIVESIVVAQDYLISENDIALDIDKIWLDAKTHDVKLLPFHTDIDFLTRICNLCESIDAADIAKKIIEQNELSAFSYKDLLSFLSSWELKLR